MLLEEAESRARHIAEDLEDAEVVLVMLAHLTWDVLVAIATDRCEDATPGDFAAAVLNAELSIYECFGGAPEHHTGVRELLEARKSAPKKPRAPKKTAKSKAQRAKPKKR